MPSRPTLADVARRAGMSPTAASQVLNAAPGARIAKESAERIRKAADELGYRPNEAARSLRVGKTSTIGFLSHQITLTRYATEMIRGALDAAHAADNLMLITEFGETSSDRDDVIGPLLNRLPDGLIVGEMGAKEITVPKSIAKVPYVLANATADGNATSILPAEYEAGLAVVDRLVTAGHQRIAILGNNEKFRSDPWISATIGDRLQGILDGFRRAGIRPAIVVDTPDWEPGDGFKAMASAIDSKMDATAVIALNDRLALGAYEATRAHGFTIPGDFSVISFDNDVISEYVHPKLTTMQIPYLQMGELAVQLLLAGKTKLGVQRVPMPLVERDSIAQI